jgi:phytoene dehydrogenase-like protein
VSAFLRPFFAGVTLAPGLDVPAELFLRLFGWFSQGSAVLPEEGMGAIPAQLSEGLPDGALHLRTPVAAIRPGAVELGSGERIGCGAVVLATDGSTTARLLGAADRTSWRGTTTLAYSAAHSPVSGPFLVLNGEDERDGPVNHLCVPSDVQKSLAPEGASLVSVSVLGVPGLDDEALDRDVREQLEGWYPGEASSWRLLRVDRIPRALPVTPASPLEAPRGVVLAGDHVSSPSIQGALESGREAADRARAEAATRSA